MTICKCIKKAIITFACFCYFFLLKNIGTNINFHHKKLPSKKFSKIANQPPPHQSPPSTFQENSSTPTITQKPHSSTRISFQENPYTFDERHARLSEPLELLVRQGPLSEPQYKPTYNLFPLLQQDLNGVRHISQNQSTLEISRQIVHPRRN